MKTASVVFEHQFDKGLLEQIDTLRTIRLHLAEGMLKNLDATAAALKERGLVNPDGADPNELRKEVLERIVTMRERLENPSVIHADEIEMVVDLEMFEPDQDQGL